MVFFNFTTIIKIRRFAYNWVYNAFLIIIQKHYPNRVQKCSKSFMQLPLEMGNRVWILVRILYTRSFIDFLNSFSNHKSKLPTTTRKSLRNICSRAGCDFVQNRFISIAVIITNNYIIHLRDEQSESDINHCFFFIIILILQYLLIQLEIIIFFFFLR